jgi:hypothetical protein
MNPKWESSKRRLPFLATALVAAAFVAGGCELDVENPNAPDAARAFQDPAGLEKLLGGAFLTWTEARHGYYQLPLTAMADNYTASWNNAALRFYTSVGSDCPSRCGWNNSATAPEAAGGGGPVEAAWYGYYTMLSGANDVMAAIDLEGICFDDDCGTRTSRNRAIAKMIQGIALAGLALEYDQGFVVDENTDVSVIRTAEFNTRQEMRDAAIQKFEEAYAEAGIESWSTDPTWMGVGAGRAYTSTQIRQLIRTMQAEVIAMFPRDATENAAAGWDSVATFASQGISSGTPFDFEYYIDPEIAFCGGPLGWNCTLQWGNSYGTMRVDTRLARRLSTNQQHPWPEAAGGNPCPFVAGIYGVDERVGDGSFGGGSADYGIAAATANAGTDFLCSTAAIFAPARGQYHQSNMAHVRYHRFAYFGENFAGDDGTGQAPLFTTQMNDLMWAEGLIRSNGSFATAAELINNSRVDRGGLTPLDGSDTQAELLAALHYEQEIEFMGHGGTPFFNWRRRFDEATGNTISDEFWLEGTPRHKPVPGKELDVLIKELYTFGGPGQPDMSIVAGDGKTSGVLSVEQIWQRYQELARLSASRRQ